MSSREEEREKSEVVATKMSFLEVLHLEFFILDVFHVGRKKNFSRCFLRRRSQPTFFRYENSVEAAVPRD